MSSYIIKKLKEIGATDINTTFDKDSLIGHVNFRIKGVSITTQFDVDNAGLYAWDIRSLSNLEKLVTPNLDIPTED